MILPFLTLLPLAVAHGCLHNPNQRGFLTSLSNLIIDDIDADAPTERIPRLPVGETEAWHARPTYLISVRRDRRPTCHYSPGA